MQVQQDVPRERFIEGLLVGAEAEQLAAEVRKVRGVIDDALRLEAKTRIHRQRIAIPGGAWAGAAMIGEVCRQDRGL